MQVEPCVVNLNPKDKTIGSGGTIKFRATSNCCEEPTYNWAITIDAGIGSSTGATGSYRAGRDFLSCGPVTETIEVTDVCSGKKVNTNVSVDACKVTIDPVSPAVDPGETIQFTTEPPQCCFNPPSYSWSLSSRGSTSGGAIDNNGLYTAGPYDGIDVVKVTDTANYMAAHTATVTVGTPTTTTTISGCVVTISPKSKTVSPAQTIQFSASEVGECSDPCYSWEISEQGSMGSTIDDNGLYTAGEPGTDMVTVTDSCNENITDSATIDVSLTTTTTVGPTTTTTVGPTTTTIPISTTTSVESTTTTIISEKSIEVTPTEVKRSRWVPLFWLMYIKGTETNFAIFKTPVVYNSKSILKLPALVLSPTDIYQIILIMPSILTGVGFDGLSETVTVTVDGANDTFEVIMLPAPFDKEKNLK